MSKIYFTAILLLIYSALMGQCPTGNVTLENQEQVDDFVANYPNCTEISGDLTVGSLAQLNSPMDLAALSAIVSVEGTLRIFDLSFYDPDIDEIISGDLTGLQNIVQVNNLKVGSHDLDGNPTGMPSRFENLNALANLEGIVDTLWLINFSIESELPDFNELTSIDYFLLRGISGAIETPQFLNLTFIRDFTIRNNEFFGSSPILRKVIIPDNLINVTLPENWSGALTTSGIYIHDNDSLLEITGGANLINIGSNIRIYSNNLLNDLSGFDNLETAYSEQWNLGGIDLASCYPEFFSSFKNLKKCVDIRISNLEQNCQETVDSIEIAIGENAEELIVCGGGVSVALENVSQIIFTGNLTQASSLNLNAEMAVGISGFQNLDSLSNHFINGQSKLLMNLPRVQTLPDFSNLVYVEDDIIIDLSNTGGQPSELTNLQGLSALQRSGSFQVTGNYDDGSNLISLDGLNNLDSIVGDLRLIDLYSLTSLDALSGLEFVNEIELIELLSLETPPTFEELTEIESLWIKLTSLTSTPVFSQLQSIQDDIMIDLNPSLLNITGFSELQEFNGLSVTDNTALSEVLFPQDVSFSGTLELEDNFELEECGISPIICNLIEQADEIILSDNGENCNDSDAISNICETLGLNSQNEKSFKAYFSNRNELIIQHSFIGSYTVSLFNLLGQEVLRTTSDQLNFNKISLQDGLNEGFYVLRVQRGKELYTETLPYFYK